mgnify:CR=1 FL=1
MKKWFCLPLQEKLKYLTFSVGAVVFLCRQYAGGFFRTGRIWKYFKEQFQKSCLLDGYGRRKRSV